MRTNTGLIVAALLLSFSGCNKGKPSPAASAEERTSGGEPAAVTGPVHKTGSGSVSATLGSGGGTLELTGGPRVVIPPGAVQGTQEFQLKEAAKTTAFFNSEHERPVGPTFIFSPEVEAPEGSSITVTYSVANVPEGWGKPSIAYEYAAGEKVGAEDSEHTKWQYEDAELSGGKVEAKLPALNGYRLQFVMTNLEAQ
jgi:hypothetical protein